MNLLKNPNFQTADEASYEDWSTRAIRDNGTVRVVKLDGDTTAEITPKSTDKILSCISATQIVPVESGSIYTLQGKIKTDELTNANAFFNIERLDQNSNPVRSDRWKDNRLKQLTGTNDWSDRQLTFVASPETKFVRVYLEVDHENTKTSGKAYFKDLFLEKVTPIKVTAEPHANLLQNAELVQDRTCDGPTKFPEEWHTFISGTGGGAARDPIVLLGGKPSYKLCPPNSGFTNVVQLVQVDPNETYTFSAHNRTFLNDAYANISVEELDKDKKPLRTVRHHKDIRLTGTHPWHKNQVTFTTCSDTQYVRVYLNTETTGPKPTGSAWFNGVRLERAATSSSIKPGQAPRAHHYQREGKTLFHRDPLGHTASVKSVGNELVCTTATGTQVRYKHDEKKKISSVRPAGDVDLLVTYERDLKGRLIGRKVALADSPDKILRQSEFTVGEYGKLWITTTDAAGHKVTGQYRDTDEAPEKPDERVRAEFDARGLLAKQIISIDGRNLVTEYAHNSEEQNVGVACPKGQFRSNFDQEGRIVNLTTPHGVSSFFDQDQNGNITRVYTVKADGTPISAYTNEYNPAGNVTRTTDIAGRAAQLTYDKAQQLTSETNPITGERTSYNHDFFGNRTEKIIEKIGTKPEITRYTHNAGNQITSKNGQDYVHDKKGNLLSDGVRDYLWDQQGRLLQITKKDGTLIAAYDYDATSRRTYKILASGDITRYVYSDDTDKVQFETDDFGRVKCYYVYSASGQRLSAHYTDGRDHYYHYNHRGDIVTITDGCSNVIASYVYDAWGNVIEQKGHFASQNQFLYSGYPLDRESGLYHLHHRYYDPQNGRFISLDTNIGELEEWNTQNGYTYCANNPVNSVDPDGQVFWKVVDAAWAVGEASYDIYKGKSWKEVGTNAALNLAGGGILKVGKLAFKGGKALLAASKAAKAVTKTKAAVKTATKAVTKAVTKQAAKVGAKRVAKVAVKQAAKQGVKQVVKRGAARVVQHVVKQGAKVAGTKAAQGVVTAARTAAGAVAKAVPKVTITRLTGPIGAGGLPVTFISFSKQVGPKLVGASSKALGAIQSNAVKFATKGLGGTVGSKIAAKFLGKGRNELTKKIKLQSLDKDKLAKLERIFSTKKVAREVSEKLGIDMDKLAKGFKIEIPSSGRNIITIRIMNKGSGSRSKPYFRISRSGKGSYTSDGKISSDKAITHIDLTKNSSEEIVKIVDSILGR